MVEAQKPYSYIKPGGYTDERKPYHEVAASALGAVIQSASKTPQIKSDREAQSAVLVRLKIWAKVINGEEVKIDDERKLMDEAEDSLQLFYDTVKAMQDAGLTANEKKRRWFDSPMPAAAASSSSHAPAAPPKEDE